MTFTGPQPEEHNLQLDCQVSVFYRGELMMFGLDENMQVSLAQVTTPKLEEIELMGALLQDAATEYKKVIKRASMTKEQKLALLRDWKSQYTEIGLLIASLEPVFGDLVGSPIVTQLYAMFERRTKAMADVLGIRQNLPEIVFGNDLGWFCYENGMGEKGHEVSVNGVTRPIRTLEDLLWLIEGVA
jgi:hypothetical protein